MTVCSKCGRDNPADATYCNSCSGPLSSGQTEQAQPPVQSGDFGREAEKIGKSVGEGFEKAGRAFGEHAEKRGKDFARWWDASLGILSPVVVGAISVVVMLVLIVAADAIAGISDHRQFWEELADFGLRYFLLFVGLAFLGSFNDYFHRRYKRRYGWIYPPVTGASFAAWTWVFAQVLDIAATTRDHPSLVDMSDFLETMVPVVFALALVIGYVVFFVRRAVYDELSRTCQK